MHWLSQSRKWQTSGQLSKVKAGGRFYWFTFLSVPSSVGKQHSPVTRLLGLGIYDPISLSTEKSLVSDQQTTKINSEIEGQSRN